MHSVMINSNFHLICVLMTAIHPESKYFELLTVGKCENALHYGAYQRFWPVPAGVLPGRRAVDAAGEQLLRRGARVNGRLLGDRLEAAISPVTVHPDLLFSQILIFALSNYT